MSGKPKRSFNHFIQSQNAEAAMNPKQTRLCPNCGESTRDRAGGDGWYQCPHCLKWGTEAHWAAMPSPSRGSGMTDALLRDFIVVTGQNLTMDMMKRMFKEIQLATSYGMSEQKALSEAIGRVQQPFPQTAADNPFENRHPMCRCVLVDEESLLLPESNLKDVPGVKPNLVICCQGDEDGDI